MHTATLPLRCLTNFCSLVTLRKFEPGYITGNSFQLLYHGIIFGGGRLVSASGSETSVSSSTPASAIIYDAYTSIIKKNNNNNNKWKIPVILFLFFCFHNSTASGTNCLVFDESVHQAFKFYLQLILVLPVKFYSMIVRA